MNREHAERVYFEQVKRAVSIEAVLARYGIELKGRGGTRKGCCPIHRGSNPTQFVVSNDLWHCFGDCKRGGSIIELVAAVEKVQPRDAALMIARWFAIESGTVISQQSQRRRSTMSGEKPSHKVFVVEGEGDNAFWHRAGSAWPHKDGKGLNLQIPAGMALSGRVVLRMRGAFTSPARDPAAERFGDRERAGESTCRTTTRRQSVFGSSTTASEPPSPEAEC